MRRTILILLVTLALLLSLVSSAGATVGCGYFVCMEAVEPGPAE